MLIPVGFGNTVIRTRIIGIFQADGNGAKSVRHTAEETGRLINATHGRKVRALLVMDSGHVILSAVSAERLLGRME